MNVYLSIFAFFSIFVAVNAVGSFAPWAKDDATSKIVKYTSGPLKCQAFDVLCEDICSPGKKFVSECRLVKPSESASTMVNPKFSACKCAKSASKLSPSVFKKLSAMKKCATSSSSSSTSTSSRPRTAYTLYSSVIKSWRDVLYKYLNQYRKGKGVSEVTTSTELEALAQGHAENLAKFGTTKPMLSKKNAKYGQAVFVAKPGTPSRTVPFSALTKFKKTKPDSVAFLSKNSKNIGCSGGRRLGSRGVPTKNYVVCYFDPK